MDPDQSDISGIRDLSNAQLNRAISEFGTFALEFIKTMIRTGIYDEEHPVTTTTISNTYRLFQGIKDVFGAITFLLYNSPAHGFTVYVEGITPKMLPLNSVLKGAVGEHFVEKFTTFLRQNKIASLTLSSSVSLKEFDVFIKLFVEWKWHTMNHQEAIDAFDEALNRHGVISVTVVGERELLGRDEHLPWEIRVALTRIKKDLNKLPMLRTMTPQQADQIKANFLMEIIRPIKYPVLIVSLLTNLDIATKEIHSVTKSEIMTLLIKGLRDIYLLDTVNYLLNEVRDKKLINQEVELKLRPLLRVLVLELANRNMSGSEPLLEECFRLGFIDMQDMPIELQKRILSGRAAKGFKAKTEVILNTLLKTKSAHEATKLLNVIMLSLPDLIRNDDTDRLNLIGFTLFKLYNMPPPPTFPGRKERILQVLTSAAGDGNLDRLTQLTCSVSKDKRQGLERLIILYGKDAVGPLIKILVETQDMEQRRAATDLLLRLGEDAVIPLVDELRSHKHPWFTVRNFVQILGEIGGVTESGVVGEFLDHPHVKVREQVIIALEKLLGRTAEMKILPKLDDSEIAVRKQAIVSLARLNSKNPELINKMMELLSGWEKVDKKHMGCILSVIRALSFYDPKILPEREVFEALLIDILRGPQGIRAMVPTLFGVHEPPLDMKLLTIDTLGYIGGQKALEKLNEMQRDNNAVLAKRSKQALGILKARIG